MPVFVAFLRGVNVGGHQKLPSAALKAVCESAGVTEVRTYLQSGNAVFRSASKSEGTVASAIRAELKKSTGLDVAVILRTPADLRRVVAENPFAEAAREQPGRLLVLFLAGPVTQRVRATLEKVRSPSEALAFGQDEVYAFFPDGAGRSKLADAFTPKKLGVECTARNWNTVNALLAMAAEI